MTNIVIWALLIIPFAMIPLKGFPEPTRLIKEVLFDIAMMGIIVYGIKDGIKFEYKNKYLGWLTAWCLFHFVFNWYWPLVSGQGFNMGAILENVHYLLAAVATFMACSFFERSNFISFAKAIAFSVTAVSVFALFQAFGLDPMKHLANYSAKEIRHVASTLDSPNLLGNYLALCLPFLLYLKGIRYALCLLVVVVALICVKSSLSIVAAVIGCSVFLLLKYRNKAVYGGIAVVLLLFGAFCFANKSFSRIDSGFTGRIAAWQEFVKRDVNPLFGNGLGVPKAYGVVIGDNYWVHPHNDYLMIWLCLGFVGVLLFGLLVMDVFRRFKYNQDNTLGFAYFASLITFFILMFGSFPMESAPLSLVGLLSYWGVQRVGYARD